MALLTRLMRICRSRPGSPATRIRHLGVHHHDQLQAFCRGLLSQEIADLLHTVAQVERDALEIELAGLDLRKSRMSLITDNRTSPEERTTSVYSRCRLSRLVSSSNPDMPMNSVQRGADLVAHVGEKLALRAGGGRLGLFVGFLQLAQCLVAFRDIADDGHGVPGVVELDGADGDLDRNLRAVLVQGPAARVWCRWLRLVRWWQNPRGPLQPGHGSARARGPSGPVCPMVSSEDHPNVVSAALFQT